MTTKLFPTIRPLPPLSLGRPRWGNLGLIASVVIFWAGVILKILG